MAQIDLNSAHFVPQMGQYDMVYDELLKAYEGLSEEEQQKLSASLLICLCNRIGDPKKITSAIVEAKGNFLDKNNC